MRQEALYKILATTIQGLGYEFVGVEYRPQGRYSLLRIYIDTPNGVNVDDCSEVSKQVSALLDVEDPIKGEYTLEVSSPGLARPLFTPEHYQRFIGKQIKLRLSLAQDGQRNFSGSLVAADDQQVTLNCGEITKQFSFSEIEKANLIPEL